MHYVSVYIFLKEGSLTFVNLRSQNTALPLSLDIHHDFSTNAWDCLRIHQDLSGLQFFHVISIP